MMDSGKLSRQLEKLPASGLLLDIKASKKILGLYLLLLLCLASAIATLQLAIIYKLMLLLVSLVVAIKILRQHVLFTHPRSIKRVLITELNGCLLELKNGQIEKLAILSQSCLTDNFAVLSLGQQRFGIQWQTFSLLLNAEMVGSKQFRRLKSQLIVNAASMHET